MQKCSCYLFSFWPQFVSHCLLICNVLCWGWGGGEDAFLSGGDCCRDSLETVSTNLQIERYCSKPASPIRGNISLSSLGFQLSELNRIVCTCDLLFQAVPRLMERTCFHSHVFQDILHSCRDMCMKYHLKAVTPGTSQSLWIQISRPVLVDFTVGPPVCIGLRPFSSTSLPMYLYLLLLC